MIARRSGGFLAFLNRSRQRYEEALREAEAEKLEACASPFALASEESSPTELPLPDSTEEASDRSEVAEALQDLTEAVFHVDADAHTTVAEVKEPEIEVLGPALADPERFDEEDSVEGDGGDGVEPENVKEPEIEVLGPALADPM